MANNYSPRRAAASGEPERRRTSAPRESGYTQERRAPRETGYTSPTRQARPSSDGYTRTPGYSMEDLTPRAPRNTAPARPSRENRPVRDPGSERDAHVRRPPQSRRPYACGV